MTRARHPVIGTWGLLVAIALGLTVRLGQEAFQRPAPMTSFIGAALAFALIPVWTLLAVTLLRLVDTRVVAMRWATLFPVMCVASLFTFLVALRYASLAAGR